MGLKCLNLFLRLPGFDHVVVMNWANWHTVVGGTQPFTTAFSLHALSSFLLTCDMKFFTHRFSVMCRVRALAVGP